MANVAYMRMLFNFDSMVFHGPKPNRAALQCVDSPPYDSKRHEKNADVRT